MNRIGQMSVVLCVVFGGGSLMMGIVTCRVAHVCHRSSAGPHGIHKTSIQNTKVAVLKEVNYTHCPSAVSYPKNNKNQFL